MGVEQVFMGVLREQVKDLRAENDRLRATLARERDEQHRRGLELQAEVERLRSDRAALVGQLVLSLGYAWFVVLPPRKEGYVGGRQSVVNSWRYIFDRREDAEAALWSALEASRTEAGRTEGEG